MSPTGVKDVALVPAEEVILTSQAVSTFERLARDPAVDVDKLERLMQMHERVTAKAAEERFNAAMSAAQTEMRPIAADANNPQTKSRYASYNALDRVLRPIYTTHGFGLSFDTGDGAPVGWVRVLCYVTHAGGHARTYHADMPADGKGAKDGDVMTVTHAVGAAMSYGMRYLLKMIFNVRWERTIATATTSHQRSPHHRRRPGLTSGGSTSKRWPTTAGPPCGMPSRRRRTVSGNTCDSPTP